MDFSGIYTQVKPVENRMAIHFEPKVMNGK
jgi:hypothetical protein